MRLKFKMMSNAGAIDSSALRSPTASESETTMAAALSMSPRRSDALENIRYWIDTCKEYRNTHRKARQSNFFGPTFGPS